MLLEDIIDTGLTMTHLLPELERFGPRSVRVASLLEKRTPAACGFKGEAAPAQKLQAPRRYCT